jgi:hypothetical protein
MNSKNACQSFRGRPGSRWRVPRIFFGRWWAQVFVFIFFGSLAGAHDPLASWAVLQVRGDRLEFRVEMGAESAWLWLGESADKAPDIEHSLARLRRQAAGIYRLSAAGRELAALETSVEQREEDGVVFRWVYARPVENGPVRFEATFVKRLPPAHRTTLTLLDVPGKVFRAEILNAAKPTVELPLPPVAPAGDAPRL